MRFQRQSGSTTAPAPSGNNLPQYLAVDSTNVYWSGGNVNLGVIMRASLQDGNVVTLAQTTYNSLGNVALDATYVYWPDWEVGTPYRPPASAPAREAHDGVAGGGAVALFALGIKGRFDNRVRRPVPVLAHHRGAEDVRGALVVGADVVVAVERRLICALAEVRDLRRAASLELVVDPVVRHRAERTVAVRARERQVPVDAREAALCVGAVDRAGVDVGGGRGAFRRGVGAARGIYLPRPVDALGLGAAAEARVGPPATEEVCVRARGAGSRRVRWARRSARGRLVGCDRGGGRPGRGRVVRSRRASGGETKSARQMDLNVFIFGPLRGAGVRGRFELSSAIVGSSVAARGWRVASEG